MVDGLVLGLGHLQHQGPVRARLSRAACGSLSVCKSNGRQFDVFRWLVVGRVVGEDGSSVEQAIVFAKVQLLKVSNSAKGQSKNSAYPAFISDTARTGTTNANADDVRARVDERLAHLLQLGALHGLSQLINGHCRDHRLVFDNGAYQ